MNFSDNFQPADNSPNIGDALMMSTPLGDAIVPKIVMAAMIGGAPVTVGLTLWITLFGGDPGQLPHPLIAASVLRTLADEGKRQADIVRAHDEGEGWRPSGPSLN